MSFSHSTNTCIHHVCQALINGRSISSRDVLFEFDCWRLSADIHKLRSQFQWPITVSYPKRDGVAYYKLEVATDIRILGFPKSASSLRVESAS